MNVITSVLLCLCLSGGGGDEDKLSVRIKPTTSVRSLDVTIGELCDIRPEGAESVALAQVRFGPAPSNGHTRVVSRTEIVQAIAASGRDVGGLNFEGAAEVVVQPIAVEVPKQDMLDSATVALQAVLALEGGDVEFQAPSQVRAVLAPPGRRTQELRARLRGDRTGPNNAVVDVDVVVDGESFRKVPLTFTLVRYQPVLKTTSTVRAGTPLGPENVAVVREPLAQAHSLFLGKVDDVTGLIASRNLSQGQRLTLGDTALPSVVHKGDVVTVVLTQGRVKVTARAMANQDAPLGGRITLTNLSSSSQMVGTVTAPGLVVVHQ